MLDRGMLRDHDRLNFHPLDNAMTTGIAAGRPRALPAGGRPLPGDLDLA